MSRTTQEAPVSLLDYNSGIGEELDDLMGIATLCYLAKENIVVNMNEDELAAMFGLIAHSIERLNEKFRRVDNVLIKERRAAS